MRDSLARIASLGRKALILGALIGAPVLAAAPQAEAALRAPIQAAMPDAVAPEAALVPVQYYGPPPRRYYHGPRHGYRPPPRHWRREQAWRRGYGPPPRPHYRRYSRGY